VLLIEKLISEPSEKTTQLLFDDESEVFWVDWREDDGELAGYCESIINTNKLSSSRLGEKLSISYGDKIVEVPITNSGGDRHITLLTINEAVYPDYEIRLVWDSDGNDTLAYAILKTEKWSEYEATYGEESVQKAFLKLTQDLNTFTDSLHNHRPTQKALKPWWQIWK